MNRYRSVVLLRGIKVSLSNTRLLLSSIVAKPSNEYNPLDSFKLLLFK